MVTTPQPPAPDRAWPAELDPAGQLGPYQPPAALLNILARLLGAEGFTAADEHLRRRILNAAEQIRRAGLDPRTIGLVAEPRITELMGVSETTGRSTRQRDKAFPRAVVRGRLWSEPDVVDYLEYRQETSPRPGALHSARVARREKTQEGPRP